MCYFGLCHDGLDGFDDVSALSVINLMATVKQKTTLKVNKNLRMVFWVPEDAHPRDVIVLNYLMISSSQLYRLLCEQWTFLWS